MRRSRHSGLVRPHLQGKTLHPNALAFHGLLAIANRPVTKSDGGWQIRGPRRSLNCGTTAGLYKRSARPPISVIRSPSDAAHLALSRRTTRWQTAFRCFWHPALWSSLYRPGAFQLWRVRLHAWIAFQALFPLIEREVGGGAWPMPAYYPKEVTAGLYFQPRSIPVSCSGDLEGR